MTTLQNDTESLMQEATSLMASCSAAVNALPNENDVSTPNGRNRVVALRSTLWGVRSAIDQHLSGLRDSDRLLPTLRMKRDIYMACEIEFGRALQTLEALPPKEQNRHWKDLDVLRTSLHTLQAGSGGVPEVMPGLLFDWLKSHGHQPENGQMFTWGGLRSITRRIADLEDRQAKARVALEAAVAHAKQVLASIEGVPVTA